MANDIIGIKYTEMVTNPNILDTDLLMTSKTDGSASYKVTVVELANKLVEAIAYATALQTENKTLAGAINELKARIDALEGEGNE